MATATAIDIAPKTSAAASARAGVQRSLRVGPPLAVFALIIGAWYLISFVLDGRGTGFLMPYPHAVFQQMFLDPARGLDLLQALGRTTMVALTGLGIAIVIGVVWAILMSQAKWVELSLFPYAVILQCIPILALVPLIGFWFGFNTPARIIVTVIISTFPMVANTLFGLQSVDKSQRELFKLQQASRWTTLWKLQFPAALPSIFLGLRNAAGLSVIGAIVGDQFFRRGEPGLGVLISNYASRLQGADLFAAIITAALLGVVVFLFFGLIGRLAIGKWFDFS